MKIYILSFFLKGRTVLKSHTVHPCLFAGNTPIHLKMTHTSGDVSIFALHVGDLRRLKPGQILLPPCQGTPISWTLLQDPAPWTIHDALNPLNAHQPSPWHEQKRKQSAPSLNEAPVRRSSHRRRPHQQPGKNLQSREELLFLLRILIFSLKKN